MTYRFNQNSDPMIEEFQRRRRAQIRKGQQQLEQKLWENLQDPPEDPEPVLEIPNVFTLLSDRLRPSFKRWTSSDPDDVRIIDGVVTNLDASDGDEKSDATPVEPLMQVVSQRKRNLIAAIALALAGGHLVNPWVALLIGLLALDRINRKRSLATPPICPHCGEVLQPNQPVHD